MRTASGRRAVFDDLAGLRIELADGPVPVSRVPDLAFLVDQQPVRMRAGGKIPFVEFLRAGVKTRDAVALHHRDVDVAVRTRGGIAREFRGGHRPLGNLSAELLRPRGDAVVRSAGKGADEAEQHRGGKKDRSLHRNLRSKANRGRVSSGHSINQTRGALTPPRCVRRSPRRSSAAGRGRTGEGAGLRTRAAHR